MGASGLRYSWAGRFEPVLNYYGELTGSGQSYGFFAPGVWGQIRASFDVIDKNDHSTPVSLDTGLSREAGLRVGNIINEFTEQAEDLVKLQRSLSSSLAGTVFGRYPEATKVVVRLEEFLPVSMQEFRAGSRAHWKPIYTATYMANRARSQK